MQTANYLALAAALPPSAGGRAVLRHLSHPAIDSHLTGAANRLSTMAAAVPPRRCVQVGAEDAVRTDVFSAVGLRESPPLVRFPASALVLVR